MLSIAIMKIRTHHWAALLFSGGIFVAACVWFGVQAPVAEATCSAGSSVMISQPPSGITLSGIANLHAYSSPTTANGLTFMVHSTNTTGGTAWQPIGEATQNGTDWFYAWDSRNLANGGYMLEAVAHYSGVSTLDCASPLTQINVNNQPTQPPTLTAAIDPAGWQGYTGQSMTFSAAALYTDQYGRQSHVSPPTTTWGASIGLLSAPNGPSTVFSAGTAAGSGTLGVQISYSGLVAHAMVPVKILAGSATAGTGTTPSSSQPTTGASGSNSNVSTSTALANMPTIFRPQSPTNSAPVVPVQTLDCVQTRIGSTRFDAISNGQSTPSLAERLKADDCFSGAQPIPAVLAPVAPSRLQDVDTTKDLVKVTALKNQIITNSQGKKVTGLLISGTGTPSSDIFVYVFSDPLVLRAQTDKTGKWSYVLETPLKPGKHEVYAVAAKDASTFVRTDPVPVSIAAAAPGSSDGSLVIESRLSASQVGFALLAAGMILASIILLMVILRRRRRRETAAAPPLVQPTPPAQKEPPAGAPLS
jgi:hypothetical protein